MLDQARDNKFDIKVDANGHVTVSDRSPPTMETKRIHSNGEVEKLGMAAEDLF